MCSPNVHFEQRHRDSHISSNPFASFSSSISPDSSFVPGVPSSHLGKALEGSSFDAFYRSSSSSTRPNGIPIELHHTISNSSSVLSLAVDEAKGLVFSGSQSESICVWDLRTYRQLPTLQGHTGSVLALELAPEKNWLFSSSGDNTVRIWDTKTLKPIYEVHPAEDNVGDIFALQWCEELETLYLGCQNTSIQWICLSGLKSSAAKASKARGGTDSPSLAAPQSLHFSRPHKFFDSVPIAVSRSANGTKPSSGGSTPRIPSLRPVGSSSTLPSEAKFDRGRNLAVPEVIDNPARSKSTERVLRGVTEAFENVNVAGDSDAAIRTPELHGSYDAVTSSEVEVLVVPSTCSVPSAHFGYIYCFTLLKLEGDEPFRTVLASGSGDESVKLWHATPEGLVHLATLDSPNSDGNAVMALASWDRTLFAGLQGGVVEVWDLETCTLVRTMRAHADDVLGLEASSVEGTLFTASADGRIRRWDRSFRCTHEWTAHDGIVLSMTSIRKPVSPVNGSESGSGYVKTVRLVTGASDNKIKIWDLPSALDEAGLTRRGPSSFEDDVSTKLGQSLFIERQGRRIAGPSAPESVTLLSSLSRFITFKSISSVEENREDCRQAAHYLKSCLIDLGAEAKILANRPGRNPLVLGTFSANMPSQRRDSSLSPNQIAGAGQRSYSQSRGSNNQSTDGEPLQARRKRILFYGHYDCIAAEGQWDSDPFRMDGRDGYLYGRGVSDNKGPILAAACAASQLLTMRQLDVDVVFLIEGEEETGSVGFTEVVRQHKAEIGPIDVILLSNSYWLDEETPCLTVGLRGVVRAKLSVSGDEPDVHSGVEGGAVQEPMIDMVKLLSSLTDGDHVTVPGFYDAVRPVSGSEKTQYDAIAKLKQSTTAESLMSKWRYPSLSVHNIRVSGPGNSTVIPSKVEATVSLRLVPDQGIEDIEASLRQHVQDEFARMRSRNRVSIEVEHRADWWLGSTESDEFRSLERAVRLEWELGNESPSIIREGGSIPAIAILEKELGAQAVHLPMGQSSDRAHLPNERIRLMNLQRGRNVVRRFLEALGGHQSV